MTKNSLFFILIAGILAMSLPAQVMPKKYEFKKPYVFQEESLLISDTDFNCSYFIRKSMSEDIRITGTEAMDYNKTNYSDGDKVFIDKGSKHGIREGHLLLAISKGETVFNRLNGKKLGTYYIKKALGLVTCLYEDKAVLTLQNGCHPVYTGDFFIPYQPQKAIFDRSPIYTRCRLPKNRVEGNVVYNSTFLKDELVIPATHSYITVDLGKAEVSTGDFLLFYKVYPGNLPIIIGLGIIIDTQNNCSTAKVLESVYPIEVGIRTLVMKKEDLQFPEEVKKMRRLYGEEKVPIIEQLEGEEGEAPAGDEQTLELNILFDINDRNINEIYKKDLLQVGEFIKDKSEYVIIIRGYACTIGGEEYNLKLSQDRADNVKKFLMETFSIKEEFFETYHYGEKESPFDNTAEEERRKNRLVNIQVIGK